MGWHTFVVYPFGFHRILDFLTGLYLYAAPFFIFVLTKT